MYILASFQNVILVSQGLDPDLPVVDLLIALSKVPHESMVKNSLWNQSSDSCPLPYAVAHKSCITQPTSSLNSCLGPGCPPTWNIPELSRIQSFILLTTRASHGRGNNPSFMCIKPLFFNTTEGHFCFQIINRIVFSDLEEILLHQSSFCMIYK